jgi:putative ABC transport system permease protein
MRPFLLLAFRNVFRNRRRTIMTMLIVAVGVAALILSGGFFAYMFQELAEGTIRFGIGHLQICNAGLPTEPEKRVMEHGLDRYEEILSTARVVPHVRGAAPRITFFGMASNGMKSDTMMAMAVDPAEERRMGFNLRISRGRDLAQDSDALIAVGLARSMNVQPGDTVKLLALTTAGTLNTLDVKVAGLFSVGMREVDDNALRLTVRAAQRLLQTDRVTTVVVGLDSTANTDAACSALLEKLRRQRPDVVVRKWIDLATFYRQCRGLFNGIFAFSGVIVFVMVVMSSANTLMMSMFERTREIGAMLAMGTRRSWILALFITEGLLTGLLGALTGVVAARIIGELLNRSGLELPPPPATDAPLPFRVIFSPELILGASILVILTLAIASLAPAIRASRLKIVEALAHA